MASSSTQSWDELSSTTSSHASKDPSSSTRRKRVKRQAKVKLTTNLQFEASHDAFRDIRRLLELFHAHSIPGPLLVRTRSDFSLEVGSGGQGQVRAASKDYASALNSLTPMPVGDGSIWSSDAAQERCISHWQSCVIKQLRSKTRRLENEAASAVREVYSLCQASKSSARSRHIVRLLGWGICLDALESRELSGAKLPFLVLEKAVCDMEQFISDGKHETEDASSRMRIALNVGKGLLAIHTANMAHGDMKLSNILMFLDRDRSWNVKICDFGSASDGDHYKLTGQYSGTDTWRPPEAFYSRNSVDLKLCDIFAYGLVVWSWFLGRDTSPINDLEADQILKARGQQQFYRFALEDIVGKYGERSDVRWLDKYMKEYRYHLNPDESSRTKRSRYCGVCLPDKSDQLMDIPTRDFKSIMAKRVLNTLAVALDEVPNRRSGQPWDYLEPSIVVRVPTPPKPFRQRKGKEKKASNTVDWQEPESSSSNSFYRLKQRVMISLRPVLRNLTNLVMFQFEHWLFVLAGGRHQLTIFRQFHRTLYDALGGNSDDVVCVTHDAHDRCVRLNKSSISSLRKLIRRNYSGNFLERCHYLFLSFFSEGGQLPTPDQWNGETNYALARLRSRFKDEACWQELFALDPDLQSSIDHAISCLRLSSSQNSAAWAFRNVTALDIPDAHHRAYFAFLQDMSLADEERTFRMHLLLERGFFLGQKLDDAKPESP